MIQLTGIIIARNEEGRIADCIDSLSFCDELVVVDNGSTDRTVEIAERMGAKIVVCKTFDFSQVRSYGLHKAKGKWVLYVDADERVSRELAENVKRVVSENYKSDKPSVYRLQRKNFYFGKHEWPHIERLERLFYKQALKGWKGKLHESPVYTGSVVDFDGYLLHYTHRNFSEMLAKTIEWSEIEASLRLQERHPKMTWWRFPRVMLTAFLDSYVRQGGYKVGIVGIVESMYQSFSMFITYARLWEMSRGAGHSDSEESSDSKRSPSARQNEK